MMKTPRSSSPRPPRPARSGASFAGRSLAQRGAPFRARSEGDRPKKTPEDRAFRGEFRAPRQEGARRKTTLADRPRREGAEASSRPRTFERGAARSSTARTYPKRSEARDPARSFARGEDRVGRVRQTGRDENINRSRPYRDNRNAQGFLGRESKNEREGRRQTGWQSERQTERQGERQGGHQGGRENAREGGREGFRRSSRDESPSRFPPRRARTDNRPSRSLSPARSVGGESRPTARPRQNFGDKPWASRSAWRTERRPNDHKTEASAQRSTTSGVAPPRRNRPLVENTRSIAAPRARAPYQERKGDFADSPRPHRGGERVQKALAQLGWGARREIEEWIAQGEVWINGKPVALGDNINVGDRVEIIRGQKNESRRREVERYTVWQNLREAPQVLIYHKPEGEIVSRSDPHGRADVFERLPRIKNGRWINIGRLDVASSGILLFTNHGELAHALMHPSSNILREYAVRVSGILNEEHIRALTQGIDIDGEIVQCQSVTAMSGKDEGRNRWYKFVLTEGKNREIRNMIEVLGFQVSRLMRTRYGPIVLPRGLRRGRHELMEDREVAQLMHLVGWSLPRTTRPSRRRPPPRSR